MLRPVRMLSGDTSLDTAIFQSQPRIGKVIGTAGAKLAWNSHAKRQFLRDCIACGGESDRPRGRSPTASSRAV